MSNFVLTKQHLREVLIFCFNWKKNAAEAHRMLVEIYGDTAPNILLINHVRNSFDVSRMKISAKDKLRSRQPKNLKTKN